MKGLYDILERVKMAEDYSSLGLETQPFKISPISGELHYFVGRERELQSLLGCISRNRNSFLIGEIGMGKTSLLNVASLCLRGKWKDKYLVASGSYYPSIRKMIISLTLDMIRRNHLVDRIERSKMSDLRKVIVRMTKYSKSPVHYDLLSVEEDLLHMRDILDQEFVFLVDNAHTMTKYDCQGNLPFLDNLLFEPEMTWLLAVYPETPNAIEGLSPSTYARVGSEINLDPFTRLEQVEIIKSRLDAARLDSCPQADPLSPFTDEAIEVVIEYTDGNGRRLMQICEKSIEMARSIGSRTISTGIVEKVIKQARFSFTWRILRHLTPRQIEVLQALVRRNGRASLGELVIDLDRTKGTVSLHMNNLIQKGLVKREGDRLHMSYVLDWDINEVSDFLVSKGET
jgi:type II secretory pathway predicted ATPase ExeA